MAKPGYNSGMKCGPPKKGTNGPNGTGGGTRVFAPPKPAGGKGIHPGTKKG